MRFHSIRFWHALISGAFILLVVQTTTSAKKRDNPLVSQGEKLSKTHCAPCHGQEGEGKVGLAPSIRNRDFLALASDKFITKTIENGRIGTAMVPRPDLKAKDIKAIIAYLRALDIPLPLNVKVNHNKKFKGNAKNGKGTYDNYCSQCHGPTGEGYIAGGSGPGIGLKGFLDQASDDYIFQTVKHGRVGTAMRSLMGEGGIANLTEKEVHNVIAYLRKNAK